MDKKANPAKAWLMRYQDMRRYRVRILASGDDAAVLHAQELDRAAKIMREVVEAIGQIDDGLQRDVLMMRYIDGWDWPKIMGVMAQRGYSERWIYSAHGRGLQKVEVMMHDTDAHG